jgi:hypothetical protein
MIEVFDSGPGGMYGSVILATESQIESKLSWELCDCTACNVSTEEATESIGCRNPKSCPIA